MSRIDELLRSSAVEWRNEVDPQERRARDRRVSAADLRTARRRRLLRRWPVQLAGIATAAAAVVLTLWLVHNADDPEPPSPGGSSTSCAAPRLQIGHHARATPLVRGETVVVTGEYFVDGCQDSPGAEQTGPIPSVRLVLTPRSGGPIVLATVHPAGALGTFRVSVTVPPDAPTGPATLGDSANSRLRVVVR